MPSLSELSIDELKQLRNQVVADRKPLSDMSIEELKALRSSMLPSGPEPRPLDRSFIGDIPAALGAGAIDTVEQFSRATRALDPQGGIDILENIGTKGVEFAKSFQEAHPDMFTAPEGTIRSSIYGGVRSTLPSVAAGIPGAVVGSVGGVPGAIGGFAASGGAVFGLAEADRFYEEAIAQGKAPDEAFLGAVKSGAWEGSWEAASDYLDILLLKMGKPLTSPAKQTLKDILKPTLKKSVKEFIKTTSRIVPVETGTEMIQEAGGAKLRQDLGMETPSPWEAAKGAIGPSIVTSILFGIGGLGMNSVQRRQITRAVSDPKVSVIHRVKAAESIANNLIGQGRQDLAEAWMTRAGNAIDKGEAIDINEDFLKSVIDSEGIKGLERLAAESGVGTWTPPYEAAITEDRGQEPVKPPLTEPLQAYGPQDILPAVPVNTEQKPPFLIKKPDTSVPDYLQGRGEITPFQMATHGLITMTPDEAKTDLKDRLTKAGISPEGIGIVDNMDIERPSDIRGVTSAIDKTLTGGVSPEVAAELNKTKRILQGWQDEQFGAVVKKNKDILNEMEKEISSGRPGERVFNYDVQGQGGTPEIIGIPSTYPDYFRNKGLVAKDVLNLIWMAKNGKRLAEGQQAKLEDLIRDKRAYNLEQSRITRDRNVSERNKPQNIPAGNLKAGDEFTIQGEKHRVIDDNENGNVVIKDGKTIVVDPFDMVPIDKGMAGVKKGKAPQTTPITSPPPVATPQTPGSVSAMDAMTPIYEHKEIRPEDKINAITREEAGKLIAKGDPTVIEHIKEGVNKNGPAAMQDAIRNQEMIEIAKAHKGAEREEVKAKIQGIEPEIDKALKGEKVKEPWEMTKEEMVNLSSRQYEKQVISKWTPAQAEKITELIRQKHPDRSDIFTAENEHEAIIKLALSEGKSIPPEVMKDYPELKGEETPVKSEKIVRFETGKALNSEQRKDVLSKIGDSYKDLNAPEVDKGIDRRGEEITGYEYNPDYMHTSDITGRKIRHYITLPDGKKAHPSELYPNITKASIDKYMAEERYREEQQRLSDEDMRQSREGRIIDNPDIDEAKNLANSEYAKRGRPQEGSYFAQDNKGRIVRVDGTDKGDVKYYESEGFKAIPAPTPKETERQEGLFGVGEGKAGYSEPRSIEEFRNWTFKHPEGGSSLTPKKVFDWREQGEEFETLADIATYEDDFRFKESLGKGSSDWKSMLHLIPNIKAGKEMTVYRAVEKGHDEIIPGAYVSESLQYAKDHGERTIKFGMGLDYEIKSLSVYPDELMTYGDPHEFIYIPRTVKIGYERYLRQAKGAGAVAEQSSTYNAPAPIFFSQMQRILESKLPNKGPASAFRGMIKMWANKGEFKQEEHKWSGVDEWLAGQKGTITKKDVIEWLRENEVLVEEVEKGKYAPLKWKTEDKFGVSASDNQLKMSYEVVKSDDGGLYIATNGQPHEDVTFKSVTEAKVYLEDLHREDFKDYGNKATKFSQYTTPGGENYRELLLTLPEKPTSVKAAKNERIKELNKRLEELKKSYDSAKPGQQRQDITRQIENTNMQIGMVERETVSRTAFRSPHWDEPNILAHVRFNERQDADGNKVLFIEEIQSDWAGEGRRKGFKETIDTKGWRVDKKMSGANGDILHSVLDENGRHVSNVYATSEKEAISLAATRRGQEGKIPNAPLLKNWQELTLKRILRYAAENDFDKISWTSGAMQQERYDLSKQVDEVVLEGKNLKAYKDNKLVLEKPIQDENEVQDYIGKGPAEKLLAQEGTFVPGSPYVKKSISGLDLKVGGKWAENLYDQMIPQFLNKFGKRWGAKVESIRLNINAQYKDAVTGDRGVATTQALPVTPSMKQSVLYEGQQLFEKRTGYGKIGNKVAYENAKKELERFTQQEIPFTQRGVGNRPPRRPQGKVLGVAIRRDLINKGRVDLRGQKTETTADIAVVSQVFRSPKIETFRIGYVKDGNVVAHTGVSSRMPGVSQVFLNTTSNKEIFDILHRAKRLGADSIFFLHNHPSGDPTPSQEDVAMTVNTINTLNRLSQKSDSKVPRFMGHVIINSGKYVVIEPRASYSEGEQIEARMLRLPGFVKDELLTPEKSHGYLSAKISGFKDVVHIGQATKQPENLVTIIYRGSKGYTRAIESISTKRFADKENTAGYLRNMAREFGATEVFAYYDGPEDYKEIASSYMRSGILRDAIYKDRSVWYGNLPKFSKGMWMGKKSDEMAVRVSEEIAKYGKQGFTPKQMIDRIFRLPFKVVGKLDAEGRWKVGQAMYRWLSDAITSKKTGNETIDAFLHHVRRGLVDKYNLPENYQQYKNLRELERNAISAEGLEYFHDIRKAIENEEQKKLIYRILTESDVPPGDWEKLSEPVRNAIVQYGQDMVDAKILSPAAFEQNKGAYLHRTYEKYRHETPAMIRAFKKVKLIGKELKHRGTQKYVSPKEVEKWVNGEKDGNTWKQKGTVDRSFYAGRTLIHKGSAIIWRDWTKEERTRMGEMEDPAYGVAVTFDLIAKDLSTGKLYKRVAEDPLLSAEEDPGGWVYFGKDKISNSSTSKWGALADKWVHPEVAQDLLTMQKYSQPAFWRSLLTFWKLSKTARNPVVHMNNIVSNFFLADMHDLPMSDTVFAIKDYKDQDQDFKDARAAGVFGHNIISAEIKRYYNPKIEEMARKGNLASLPIEILKRGDRFMLHLYSIEDDIFRLALFKKLRREGKSVEEASQEAIRQFIDYDISAPWIQFARNTFLPFVSYPYRALPLITEAALTRPWKLVKYYALFAGIQAVSEMIVGVDSDDERNLLQDYYRGLTWIGVEKMLRTPWGYLDISRYLPGADIFDLTGKKGNVEPAIPIPSSLNPGGPIDIGISFLRNQDPFTGKKIREKETPLHRQAEDVALWVYRQLGPNAPWVPGSYSWKKIMDAYDGVTDELGRPLDLKTAIPSTLGVKISRFDPELQRLRINFEAGRSIEDAKRIVRQEEWRFRKGETTKEHFLKIKAEQKAIAARYKARIDEAKQTAKKLMSSGAYAPGP